MFALTSSRVFKKKLLACALQAALPVLAGSALMAPGTAFAQTVDPTKTTELAEIVVTSSADASAEGLSKPYAGGQVARGGRAGILGTQDNMDTPFSITSYTNELIQNQQARSVGDVLQNDPSIRVARGYGNFQESYFIRGFLLSSDNMAYNGLYSLLPRQYISSELFERVEVLHGASTFLTGITPSGDGIGGTINLLPKRAGNTPLTQITAGTASGSQAYIAGDIARRFGPDDSTGIRVNAAHRDGGTGVDRENVKLDVFSVGLDWRSSNARLSMDIGHQEHQLNETRTNVGISGLTSVPRAPDSSSNWAQPGSYSDERDTFGTVRGEYDINEKVTTWFAAGMRKGKEANSLGNLDLSNAVTGAGTTYRFDNTADETIKAGELGIRGKLVTGAVKHTLVASYAYFGSERKNAYTFDPGNTQNTNLYNPVLTTLPAFSGGASGGGNLANPNLTAKKELKSYAIGDTMSFAEDKVLVTVGARHQTVDTKGYDYNTTALTSSYKESRISPAAGIVFKPAQYLSIYANYIESLSPGTTAPALDGGRAVQNVGDVLAPYVAKQKEVGLKYDGGNLGASAVIFTTDKPRVFTNAAGFYGAQGTDNHKGLELSAFGEITRGFKVLGGITFLDAKQDSTGSNTTDGKRVIGVPKVQGSLGAEWDIPGARGFAVNGRVTATGSSYADATNTLKVPGWARLDVGARYLTEVQGKLVTIRARLDNVTDRNYWASVGGTEGSGYLVLGNPRTFSLTASIDF